MSVPRVFGMGACLLHGPMSLAIRSGEIDRTTIGRGGSTPGTYSFGEMLQLLDFLEGKFDVPDDMKPICGYHVGYRPGPGAPGFVGADVCLIEPNGVVDIAWNGFKTNRAQIQRYVLNPIKTLGRDQAKMASNWYNRGILPCNDEVKDQIAADLVPLIPDDFENREMIVSILTTARGEERNVAADMEEIMRRLPIPVGVLAYAYQYLPDGRPMFWPADFQTRIKAVVAQYDLPYFEPWRMVMDHGGQPVLKPDLRHYQEEFIPSVASAIAQFAGEVAERGKIAA